MLVTAANLLPGEAVEWRREAIAHFELWRLWTGQFCHWSLPHLAGNLAAVVAIGVIAGRPIRRWLAALPMAAPLLSVFLLVAVPGLDSYRGLSGLVGVLVASRRSETRGRLPGSGRSVPNRRPSSRALPIRWPNRAGLRGFPSGWQAHMLPPKARRRRFIVLIASAA